MAYYQVNRRTHLSAEDHQTCEYHARRNQKNATNKKAFSEVLRFSERKKFKT